MLYTIVGSLLKKEFQALLSLEINVNSSILNSFSITNTIVTKILGDDILQSIELLNKKTGDYKNLNVDGLFVAIGRKPDTEIFSNEIELTQDGFIKTDEQMRTSVKNVYAVGDVRTTSLRQIVTACADGAIAVNTIIMSN